MLTRTLAIAFVGLALAPPLWGQELRSPSDLDLALARVKSAEAQNGYFAMLIERLGAEAKVRADWWAAYVAGLSPSKEK